MNLSQHNLSQPPRSKIKQTKKFVKCLKNPIAASFRWSWWFSYVRTGGLINEFSLLKVRPLQKYGGRRKAGLAFGRLFLCCQIPCRRQPPRPGKTINAFWKWTSWGRLQDRNDLEPWNQVKIELAVMRYLNFMQKITWKLLWSQIM